MINRNYVFLLLCLLPAADTVATEPGSTDSPPPDNNGNVPVAEGAASESPPLDLRMPPQEADEMQIMDSSGAPTKRSREEQLIYNYETDNVGIHIPPKNSDDLGLKLQLIDNPDDDFSRTPHW